MENTINKSRRPGKVKNVARIVIPILTLLISSIACDLTGSSGPEKNAVLLDLVANSNLHAWLETAVDNFNDADFETADGLPIYVEYQIVEAGQSVVNMTSGGGIPALWIPDDPVWGEILADQGVGVFADDCDSVVESPLVIAMWRPIAEALGWPGRELGWLDVGSLAADPSAWDYYSGGQYGDSLRLGHTHPGLSASGTGTLLSLVQAAQSKTEAVQPEEIQLPIVQASVGAFEAAVSWFSSSTEGLAQTMRSRGIDFLGAAIVYESTVYEYGSGNVDIVPIYPLEGTFIATNPACINSSLSDERMQAAEIFRNYLLGEEGQQLALEHGLREVSGESPTTFLSNQDGFDVHQPARVFDAPSVDSVYAAQDLWQSARKDVNLAMLIDISGSMRGNKIASVQDAAVRFVEQMGDDDYISIIAFANETFVLVEYQQVGEGRTAAIDAIRNLEAGGNTPLYDALGVGAALIDRHSSSQYSNALVVLTDGMDTGSTRYDFDRRLFDLVTANGTTVFAIAYGNDADEDLLEELALQTNGNFYIGDEASLILIYEEMSAAFGGNVGVGR
jgi:Ca-activated chloride channel family protein